MGLATGNGSSGGIGSVLLVSNLNEEVCFFSLFGIFVALAESHMAIESAVFCNISKDTTIVCI